MDLIKTPSIRSMHLSKREGLAPAPPPTAGSLHLTPHHLIFRPTSGDELWIPLPILYSVTRNPPTITGSPTPLILRTRDFAVYELSFGSSADIDGVWDSLKALCTGVAAEGIEGLYAFFYEGERKGDRKGKGKAGWGIYQPEKEFQRMGLGSRSKAWRTSAINADFEFCPSYPADIVVPSKISDTTLSYAVKYRSKGRLPGLVYLHWANLGSITRSSQPMVGITQGARSIQDEKLLEAVFTSHAQHSHPRQAFTLASPSSSSSSLDSQGGQIVYGAQATNIIIDARPSKNAYANSVKGAGTENMSFYKNCKKEYLGIDNIHVMRSSLNSVYDALRESETTGYVDRNALRQSNWLSHLTNILDGILIITRTIHLYNSHVLVHCSDGWDRTSQLSALPQICLDPYYRTAEGLAVLIEKDWIAYGHRFADRSGHLCGDRVQFVQGRGDDTSAQQAFLASVTKQFSPNSHAFKETCPVFQQFLDCIYQLQRQFPERFEWNGELLKRLQYETYAGKSGTFLFNSERERAAFKARERTKSVWEDIFDEVEVEGEEVKLKLKDEFGNPRYNPSLDDPDSRQLDADQGVLLVDPQDVKWWFELFGRTEEEMNGRPVPESEREKTVTAVTVVEGVEDDPVLSPVAALTSSLGNLRPTSSSPPPLPSAAHLSAPPQSSSRPSSPSSPSARAPAGLPLDLPSQAQVAEAVSSVQKFGWSAWKTVQKYGQEAATRYAESQQQQREQAASPSSESGHSRPMNGESSGGSSWRAFGRNEGASELRSGTRAPAPSTISNPWASADEALSSSSSRISTATPPSPTKTRSAAPSLDDPLAFDSTSTSAKRSADPLSANPWDTPSTISKPAPPTSQSTRPSTSYPAPPLKEQPPKGADVDPLGVGFS
ncbi:protein-tyrosine phosphatase-like protein [Leucosporidium creatinivorum]|uniref:Protein-tyrosine phosphatase-like protein n=1 Tax=Leucosporidium creatinivorum TaxID=106004 RepID=A0A1Y2FD42_9BASI|nr:protein-tyrosine phosphatase-like protein [Leucosporidium creatinivorum]